jgi:membrane associated rhomboid family serine protease
VDVACYRHPDREAGVACQRCERPICPSCMHQASVGFHCPECVKERGQRVYTPSQLGGGQPVVTMALIGMNAVVFVLGLVLAGSATTNGSRTDLGLDGGLASVLVAQGEWYRLVTSGFLHVNLVHVGLNMLLLWVLGRLLEPAIGSPRFLLLYATSLLAGSFGVVVLDQGLTVGASGAVFGLMGAAVVAQRLAGIDPWRSGIGPTIALNLVFTFAIPGISIGGHIGGLLGGAAAAWLLLGLPRTTGSKSSGIAACAALAVVAAVGAVLLAQAAHPEVVGLSGPFG